MLFRYTIMYLPVMVNIFFFKQKTAYEIVSRDWSSDVCSSDLKQLSGIAIDIIFPLVDGN